MGDNISIEAYQEMKQLSNDMIEIREAINNEIHNESHKTEEELHTQAWMGEESDNVQNRYESEIIPAFEQVSKSINEVAAEINSVVDKAMEVQQESEAAMD